MCLVFHPVPFCRAAGLSPSAERQRPPQGLGQSQAAGTVPGLLRPWPQSHPWEMEGVKTFLQGEGMSCFGPGLATQFQLPGGRRHPVPPRLNMPMECSRVLATPGILGSSGDNEVGRALRF